MLFCFFFSESAPADGNMSSDSRPDPISHDETDHISSSLNSTKISEETLNGSISEVSVVNGQISTTEEPSKIDIEEPSTPSRDCIDQDGSSEEYKSAIGSSGASSERDNSLSPTSAEGDSTSHHSALSPCSSLAPLSEETDESALERSNSAGWTTEGTSGGSSSANGSPAIHVGRHNKSGNQEKRKLKTRSTTFFESISPSNTRKKASAIIRKAKSIREKKLSREMSLDSASVSLAQPEMMTSWDPTCLLEELYQDCRPVVPQSSTTGENNRYSGFLDKLPVNQRKSTVMKGWKTRFFRLTRGSLFYYEDVSSTKAISFIRLTDSKIMVDLDSVKIEITEKGSGNLIVLRADNKEEALAWQRALQLEAVHPTMTHRVAQSQSPALTTPTLIIDLGSCSVRAGIASENAYPQLFFPTVCAEDEESGDVLECGLEALLPSMRSHCKLVYPRRFTSRMDSNDSIRPYLHCIVEKIIHTLQIDPSGYNAIVAISSLMPESQQRDLVELMLETFSFHGILLQEQSILSLYSYNCTSGIVINAGETIDVVPVLDGYKLDAGSSHIPYCGHTVTESLSKYASQKDIRYFSGIEMYIIRYIKENLCFVSADIMEDEHNCDENPSAYIRAVDVDRFNLPDHKKVIHLDSALFKAPEGLFNPGTYGKDVPGIHDLVVKAIEQCPMDMRKEMSRRIYLAGGTTLMVGFPERLEIELQQLLMPRSDVQVHGSEHRQHSAYIGAAVLATLASFEKSIITLEEWSENGLEALKKSTI